MIRRLSAIIAPLLLLGCATVSHVFDPMTDAELQQEWDSCQRGALCRGWVNLIGAESPEMDRAAYNGKRNCLEHAREARRILGRGEVYVFCTVDRTTLKVEGHAVLLVDGKVVDNGALSGVRVFPQSELGHYERSCRHAIALIEYRGEPWVVDNGALRECGRVCRAWDVRGFVAHLERSNGENCAELITRGGLQ